MMDKPSTLETKLMRIAQVAIEVRKYNNEMLLSYSDTDEQLRKSKFRSALAAYERVCSDLIGAVEQLTPDERKYIEEFE
jgi:hypothetical protein